MDLLAFAKGPGMQWAVAIFVAGTLWRPVGVFLLPGRSDLSAPRNPAAWKGLRLIVTRLWPRREFRSRTALTHVLGYAFHVGFFVVLFLYLPHILFFEDVAKGLLGVDFKQIFGFAWPYLPGPLVYFFAAIAVAALAGLLVHRLTNPVKRLISNFDDYFSWLVTIAPLVTGMLAYGHAVSPYETILGLHILSVELLMVWFPFGKLMHAFTVFATRGTQGMQFERKGATL